MGKQGIGAVHSAQLDLLVYGWEKRLGEKSNDPKFARCTKLIHARANLIITELRNLRATASPAEINWTFDDRFEYLDMFAQLCYSQGSAEAEKIEAGVKDLWPKPPKNLPPPTPQLDSHPSLEDSSHEGHHHFWSDLMAGTTACWLPDPELVQRVGNVVGTMGAAARRIQREGLIEQTGNLLDAMGVTDQNISDLIGRVAVVPAAFVP